MMRPPDGSSTHGLWHLATLGLAIFLGVVIAAAEVAQANSVTPVVGDIIAFRAGVDVPRSLQSRDPRRSRHLPSGSPSRGCILDPAIMARAGGSLVVEAARSAGRPDYVVHWAGGRTSAGELDCGTDVDLVLDDTALGQLARIVGGFGVDQRARASAGRGGDADRAEIQPAAGIKRAAWASRPGRKGRSG